MLAVERVMGASPRKGVRDNGCIGGVERRVEKIDNLASLTIYTVKLLVGKEQGFVVHLEVELYGGSTRSASI